MTTPAVAHVSIPASQTTEPPTTLVIACGAIAHELVAVLKASQCTHVRVRCLPAEFHNTPQRIVPAIEAVIVEEQHRHAQIFVAYGDCGTGGQLDTLLQRYGIERLPGDHCYAFFSGIDTFNNLAEQALGTFYLTDYLARNFNRLIVEGLGMQRHPELKDIYFAHYTRVVYLTQFDTPAGHAAAQQAANYLDLPLSVHTTGLTPLSEALSAIRVSIDNTRGTLSHG